MPKLYPITEQRYKELLKKIEKLELRDLKLHCLEEAGVDNWSGYSDAMRDFYSYLVEKADRNE